MSELTDRLTASIKTAQSNIKANITVSAIAGPYPPELWADLERMARQVAKQLGRRDWEASFDYMIDLVLTQLDTLDIYGNPASYLNGAARHHYSNIYRKEIVRERRMRDLVQHDPTIPKGVLKEILHGSG